MKRLRIEVICDEFTVVDSLNELAAAYEDTLEEGEYELSCGTAIIEEYMK